MTRVLATLSLLFAGVANAATLDIGNVAPGAGEVRLVFAGSGGNAALDYLEFQRTEHALGPLEVTAIGAGDRVLAQGNFVLESRAQVDALLVLTGNGTTEMPYALRLYDGVNDADTSSAKVESVAYALHHLAPFAGATTATAFEAVLTCAHLHADGNGGGSEGVRVTNYGHVFSGIFTSDGDTLSCRLKTAYPAFGSFDLETEASDGTLRVLLVGDGLSEPARVLILQNGVVQRVAEESAPAVGAVLRSQDFWFDLARPAQGVGLYEMPGSDDTFGTWFTHDEGGQPVWYFFDGHATDVPGQRDLVVYRPSKGAQGTALGVAGSARLFYLDCNQAELRVLLGSRDYFTLRLQRSREVSACDKLQ